MTRRPDSSRYRTLSEIIARFSSRVVRKASRTWWSHDLPKIVTQAVPADRTARRPSSRSARPRARRVEPKEHRRGAASGSPPPPPQNFQALRVAAGPPPSPHPPPPPSRARRVFCLSSAPEESSPPPPPPPRGG